MKLDYVHLSGIGRTSNKVLTKADMKVKKGGNRLHDGHRRRACELGLNPCVPACVAQGYCDD